MWKKLDEVLQSIPANEKVILAGDMNGHVGADRSGVERWHGGHGYGSQNEEGKTILQCAQMYDLAIANTFFKNNDQHLRGCAKFKKFKKSKINFDGAHPTHPSNPSKLFLETHH